MDAIWALTGSAARSPPRPIHRPRRHTDWTAAKDVMLGRLLQVMSATFREPAGLFVIGVETNTEDSCRR